MTSGLLSCVFRDTKMVSFDVASLNSFVVIFHNSKSCKANLHTLSHRETIKMLLANFEEHLLLRTLPSCKSGSCGRQAYRFYPCYFSSSAPRPSMLLRSTSLSSSASTSLNSSSSADGSRGSSNMSLMSMPLSSARVLDSISLQDEE